MALTELWSNNASTVLALPIAPTDTTMTVVTGTGGEFPSITPGSTYFRLTLTASANPLSTYEIVFVTAVSGDTFTIQRAQEGTAAQAWLTGDMVYNTITAGAASTFIQSDTPTAITIADFGASLTSSGWQNLPGGLLLQWGNGIMVGSPNSTSVYNFPVLFPNQCLQITGSPVANLGSFTLGFEPVSLNTFRVGIYSSAGLNCTGLQFSFFAIGY